MIDLVKLKQAIQKNELRTFIKKDCLGKERIYIQDTQNGESVCVGEVKQEEKSELYW